MLVLWPLRVAMGVLGGMGRVDSSWWAAGFGEFTQEGKLMLAVGTEEGFGGWKFEGDFEWLAEELADFGAVVFGGAGGESVVTHSHEVFGQDVETPAADEFVGVEFEDGGFVGGGAGPFEEDVAVGVVAEDALGAEGGALDVSGKVSEGGFAAADGLELDVPFDRGAEGAALVGGEFGEEVGMV